jgi:hypothetical protein
MDKSVEAIEARVAFDRMISERNAGADRPRRPVSAPTGPLVPVLTVTVYESEAARIERLAHAATDVTMEPDRRMLAELDAILGAGLVKPDPEHLRNGFLEPVLRND